MKAYAKQNLLSFKVLQYSLLVPLQQTRSYMAPCLEILLFDHTQLKPQKTVERARNKEQKYLLRKGSRASASSAAALSGQGIKIDV